MDLTARLISRLAAIVWGARQKPRIRPLFFTRTRYWDRVRFHHSRSLPYTRFAQAISLSDKVPRRGLRFWSPDVFVSASVSRSGR